jgi:flagellar protein FlbB
MARVGTMGSGVRVFALLLLVAVLGVGGLFWFDFLGLITADEWLAPVRGLVGLEEAMPAGAADDPFLLDRERLAKRQEQLDLRRDALDKREAELEARALELNQLGEQLQETERSLQEREKSFNDRRNTFENRRVNLEQNARYLVGMPPQEAVDILLAMENDMDIVDILRMAEQNAQEEGEQSLVAYWLSLMPPARSAALVRKMGRPGT